MEGDYLKCFTKFKSKFYLHEQNLFCYAYKMIICSKTNLDSRFYSNTAGDVAKVKAKHFPSAEIQTVLWALSLSSDKTVFCSSD